MSRNIHDRIIIGKIDIVGDCTIDAKDVAVGEGRGG